MEKQKEKFVITEEMIKAATDYISYVDKLTIVVETADDCLEPIDKSIEGIAKGTSLAIPQLYKERNGARLYFLMYYFLTRYLNLAIKEEEWDDQQYDYYASSHIFNQLERFKSGDVEIRSKVFDILYDYKQLKVMLETEIYNLKEIRNSGLDRIQGYLDLFATPENVSKLNDLLQKTLTETEAAQKKLNEKRAATYSESKSTEV